jgi:hypothetical protein
MKTEKLNPKTTHFFGRSKAQLKLLPIGTSLHNMREILAKTMRPSRVLILLTGMGLALLAAQPSQSQENNAAPSPATTRAARQPSSAQLSQQFRDGFLKGCLNGKTPGVNNQSTYCTCLAGAYQSRYDGPTLAAISQLAARSGQSGPALVNVMMGPEAKSCTAKS